MIPWLNDSTTALPNTSTALAAGSEAPGLLAAGGELTPQRLTEAYNHGVFPWYSEGQPILWWAPNPRMVLLVDEFKLSKSLRKTVTKFNHTPGCELRIDSDYKSVMQACANAPRDGQDGTWIVDEMIDAYTAWHRLGRAHSFEVWVDGELTGGLYGVSFGRMFFGESMFARRTDASKIALAALVCFCREHGVDLIDCQQRTEHLTSMGGRELSRAEFEGLLTPRLREADITDWSYHPSLWAHLKPEKLDNA